MTYPTVVATYAGGFAILFVILSLWVTLGRFRFSVLHGDGDNAGMLKRMRAHANFAEYVPFTLLLVALLEMRGANSSTLHLLLAPLAIARLAHPFGMFTQPDSAAQFLTRGVPAIVTWLVLVMAGLLLLFPA